MPLLEHTQPIIMLPHLKSVTNKEFSISIFFVRGEIHGCEDNSFVSSILPGGCLEGFFRLSPCNIILAQRGFKWLCKGTNLFPPAGATFQLYILQHILANHLILA